jgi:hypothetical protein
VNIDRSVIIGFSQSYHRFADLSRIGIGSRAGGTQEQSSHRRYHYREAQKVHSLDQFTLPHRWAQSVTP